jgi:hypothetical protein
MLPVTFITHLHRYTHTNNKTARGNPNSDVGPSVLTEYSSTYQQRCPTSLRPLKSILELAQFWQVPCHAGHTIDVFSQLIFTEFTEILNSSTYFPTHLPFFFLQLAASPSRSLEWNLSMPDTVLLFAYFSKFTFTFLWVDITSSSFCLMTTFHILIIVIGLVTRKNTSIFVKQVVIRKLCRKLLYL